MTRVVAIHCTYFPGAFFEVALTIIINRSFTHFCFKVKRCAVRLTLVIKNTTQQPMPTLQWTCTAWSWVQCLNYLTIGSPILHSVCNTIILKHQGQTVCFGTVSLIAVISCRDYLVKLPCEEDTTKHHLSCLN